MAANQLDAILYPKAVAMAVFTFWDVLLKKSRDDLARRLGLSSHQEPETTWQSMMMSRGKDQPPPSNPFSPVAGRQQQAGSLLGDGSSQQQQAKSSSSSQAGSIQGGPPDFTGLFKKLGGGTGGEGEAAEPSGVMSQSVMMAFQAASLTLARNWKRSEQHVGRGCIRVDGLVELQGRSAFMVVYVLGWFDPKANKFVNVETKLKHLVQTKQRPMGGN